MHQTVKPSRDKLSRHIGTIAYINFRQSSVQVIKAIVEHDTLKLILSHDIQHFLYTVSCNNAKGRSNYLTQCLKSDARLSKIASTVTN